jgi:sugar transferase (PEP-CTERM/EpsH1 system associated)
LENLRERDTRGNVANALVKVLFLSQRVPYPPDRGDKITTWRLIERLRRRHEVRILAFAHDDRDVAAARELAEKGFPIEVFRTHPRRDRLLSLPLLLTAKPLTLGVFGSRALQASFDRWVAESDLVYAYSSSMGAFMLEADRVPRVMHFAELDSDKWRQYAERTSPPQSWIYRREWKTLYSFERRLAHAVDLNVFCTPLEQRIFEERIPGAPSVVMPNGVDLAAYRPTANAPEPGHLVFVGVMNYYPNVDGCLWFCEEILPALRGRHPDVRLSIVGAHPSPEIRRLASLPGVEVTGFVDDPRAWLRRAAVSVAPLRIARGIQNKVLEAMAMGLPVVGTTSATQGVGGDAGRDFVVADDAPGQVAALHALLSDPRSAAELGARARAFVEGRYDWEVALRPLDAILERLQSARAR